MGIVPEDLHRLLVSWAIWARGTHFDKHFKLICRSLERKHISHIGDVYTSVEDVLRASLRRHNVIRDHDMLQVERAVMKLPERHRMAVRLHYVMHKRLSMLQKRRLLRCTENEYEPLVIRGAMMVARRLNLST